MGPTLCDFALSTERTTSAEATATRVGHDFGLTFFFQKGNTALTRSLRHRYFACVALGLILFLFVVRSTVGVVCCLLASALMRTQEALQNPGNAGALAAADAQRFRRALTKLGIARLLMSHLLVHSIVLALLFLCIPWLTNKAMWNILVT